MYKYLKIESNDYQIRTPINEDSQQFNFTQK